MLYHFALEISSSKALIWYGTYRNCAKSQRNSVLSIENQNMQRIWPGTQQREMEAGKTHYQLKKKLSRNFIYLHIPSLIRERIQTINQGLAKHLLLKNGSIF